MKKKDTPPTDKEEKETLSAVFYLLNHTGLSATTHQMVTGI